MPPMQQFIVPDASETAPPTPRIDDGQDRRAARLTVAVCLLFTILLGLLSKGVHHDDDLTHYLFARWSATYPGYLLHMWGRPGMTVPMAAFSWLGDREIGWHLARYMSALVSAAAALCAAGYARRLGLKPSWPVALLCYAQPYYTLLAFTTLTENFTALYLMAALWMAERRRVAAASAVFSLALLTRHEAILFVPLWWLVVWQSAPGGRSRWLGLGLSLWAPVVHNVLHALAFEAWPFAIYLRPGGSTEYLPQPWWSYVPHAMLAVGPVVASLAVAGAWSMLRRGQWQAPAFAGLFFLAHAAIKALGVYASGGYARFMVAVAPLVAVLALSGWRAIFRDIVSPRERSIARILAICAWIFGWIASEAALAGETSAASAVGMTGPRLFIPLATAAWVLLIGVNRRRLRLLRGLAICIVALAWLLHFGAIVRPLPMRADQRLVMEVVDWLERTGRADSPVFAPNPWFAYALGLVEDPRADKGPELLDSMPIGTIFVWDSKYTGSDFHGISKEAVEASGAYEPLKSFESKIPGESLTIELYAKTGDAALQKREIPRFPPPLTGSREPVRGIFYVREAR